MDTTQKGTPRKKKSRGERRRIRAEKVAKESNQNNNIKPSQNTRSRKAPSQHASSQNPFSQNPSSQNVPSNTASPQKTASKTPPSENIPSQLASSRNAPKHTLSRNTPTQATLMKSSPENELQYFDGMQDSDVLQDASVLQDADDLQDAVDLQDVDNRDFHLALLREATVLQEEHELDTAPIFTASALSHFKAKNPQNQYGFIAGQSDLLHRTLFANGGENEEAQDPRVFFNISAPSSAFICGSQGSGKSHTLTSILENCLMTSPASHLQNPLAGLLFHYDSFSNDKRGTPCEAAHLSHGSKSTLGSCVLRRISAPSSGRLGQIKIEPLCIDESYLTTERMLDLMAVKTEDKSSPLYLQVIIRILRNLRTEQQEKDDSTFDYGKFKGLLEAEDMTSQQNIPLKQRLGLLESVMPKSQTISKPSHTQRTGGKKGWKPNATPNPNPDRGINTGNNWKIEPGSLTIVDLLCPCVTSEGACALFNICLQLFLEQTSIDGRLVALDEAHKFMNEGTEAKALTKTLLNSVRLQRHIGTRIFIATQEPTISKDLLALCSFTIVHRFSSPQWLECLRKTLAAFHSDNTHTDGGTESTKESSNRIFNQIVKLRVGQALLFAPSAIKDMEKSGKIELLGTDYMKINIRARIAKSDGGKSVLAKSREIPRRGRSWLCGS